MRQGEQSNMIMVCSDFLVKNGVEMGKNRYGICHICGKYDRLSFEHIPPEAALNKKGLRVYSGNEVIKSFHGDKSRYLDMQRGIGKYSLCENCNSKTGQWYAATYCQVAKEVAINRNMTIELNHGTVIEYKFRDLPALAFVKQVLTMFCSLLPWEEVHRLGFDQLLLNKESNLVDANLFDLRMYLISPKTAHLLTSPMTLLYLSDGQIERLSITDLCAYPFGFILNLSPEVAVEYGTSLNELLKCEYKQKYCITLPLIYLERANTEFPLPLQYKPLPNIENKKEQIE